MRAARFYQAKDVRVEEIEEPMIGKNDVKVEVAWAGICGSDLHEYNAGPITIPGEKEDPLTGQKVPITMGHEFSGIVKEVGENVSDLNIGDKVVVNPLIVSGQHENKLIDMYQGFQFVGLGADGGFADYTVVERKNIVKVDSSVDLEVVALLEPTAVALQAIRESNMQFGDSVVIFGAGPIGLATILAARAAGAKDIFVFDISQKRLEKAKEIGATFILNTSEADPNEFIRQYYPYGVDRTFEVAGVKQTFEQSIQVTQPRGVVTIVSIFEKAIEFNPMALTASGVKIASSLAYEDDIFELTVKMIENGQIDPSPLITEYIQLENIVEQGFEKLENDKSQAKILVKLSGEN